MMTSLLMWLCLWQSS